MDWLRGDELAITRRDATYFTDNGATEELAYAVATGLNQFSLLDIIDIADILEAGARRGGRHLFRADGSSGYRGPADGRVRAAAR